MFIFIQGAVCFTNIEPKQLQTAQIQNGQHQELQRKANYL